MTCCIVILSRRSTVSKGATIRTGKIRFFGGRNSVLLKASSEARCAPRNFVLLVKCLPHRVPHRAPNKIDYRKKNVYKFRYSCIQCFFLSLTA